MPKTTETKIKKVTKKNTDISVFSIKGEKTESASLDKSIMDQKPNDALTAQYVRMYLANQRQGNASVKTRSEVIGTTQKVWRQKGTGRARHGAAKANLFRGGGVTFGPMPRDFSLSMNKKQKKQVLFSTLSQKLKDGNIKVLDIKGFGEKPKTKKVAEFIKSIGAEGKKVLFVLPKIENNPFIKSVSNLPKTDVIQATTLNTYEILNHEEIVFVNDGLAIMEKHFLTKNEN